MKFQCVCKFAVNIIMLLCSFFFFFLKTCFRVPSYE